jgi:GNAT-family acetyltransferase (TIGR03103 family)
MSRLRHPDPRLLLRRAPSLNHQQTATAPPRQRLGQRDVKLECGWGRLILAHTYRKPEQLARDLAAEAPEQRNIAFYVRDPHVILAQAPQELFLDPSHTYRIWLSQYRTARLRSRRFLIRRLRSRADAAAINRLYCCRHMVPTDPDFVWKHRTSKNLSYVVAEDVDTGEVIGTVTGIDHVHAWGDPEGGCSLWCLAVDPQISHPGVGQALVRYLLEHYQARGRTYLDLSVMHDNEQAIALYQKLGFERVPVFAVKRKNAINEPLFTAPPPDDVADFNIYARIIVDEARRRGMRVDVLDASGGYFRLSWGGRTVACRESLSELTSAVAMSRCQDKTVTHRLLTEAGLRVPAQHVVQDDGSDVAFLRRHGSVVVKPRDGEQGHGISVDVRDEDSLREAIQSARHYGDTVLLERYCAGEDLRVIVIGQEVVAAAVRRPPEVVGDGRTILRELIEKLSRRREAATGGESKIPLDAETARCIKLAGFSLDQALPAGEHLAVRKTANLHTGGTLHDVTGHLHPTLAEAAVSAARALDIPVTGLDLIVAAPEQPDYVIIEANERPGLANHEPQPTAERFLDLLFPGSGSDHGSRHAGESRHPVS